MVSLEGFANCIKFFGPFPRGIFKYIRYRPEILRDIDVWDFLGYVYVFWIDFFLFFSDQKCGEIFIDRITDLLFQVYL